MRPRAPLAVAIALAVLSSAAVARADLWTDVAAQLERLEYDEAIARLTPVAASAERPARDRLRALELVGVAHVGAGRDADAREAFSRLRSADPGWALEDRGYSPKIRQLFASAAPPSRAPADLSLEADVPVGGELTVHARFDAGRVAADALELRFRWSDDGPWSTAAGAREPEGGWFRVPRPAGLPGTTRLRAVALVRAPSGELVARGGTDEAPVLLAIAAPPAAAPPAPPRTASRGSIFGTWWFWTAAGVVATGVGVGVILVATSGEDRPEPTLGSQTMR